jgi:hypothetical protein
MEQGCAIAKNTVNAMTVKPVFANLVPGRRRHQLQTRDLKDNLPQTFVQL